jgi:hypothetical protein
MAVFILVGVGYMICHTVELTVPNAKAEMFYDFMIDPCDERYSGWWKGEHLQFHIVKNGDDNHIGDLVFMDEWLTNNNGKRHRLKFHTVVVAADFTQSSQHNNRRAKAE